MPNGKSSRGQILTSQTSPSQYARVMRSSDRGFELLRITKVYSLPNANTPGNVFLSEKVLQRLAAEKGRMLSRVGKPPEIKIVQVMTEAERTVASKTKQSAASA